MAEEDGAVEHTLRRPRVLETTLPHPEAVSRVERYRSHDRQGAEDLVHETRLRADAAFDDDVAIKPSVYNEGPARLARPRERGGGHAARPRAAGQDALAQPYQHGTDGAGERDLVYLDAGESDAMTKHAVLEVECDEPERPWKRPRHLSTPARTDRCAHSPMPCSLRRDLGRARLRLHPPG